jgi:hypothetical protein
MDELALGQVKPDWPRASLDQSDRPLRRAAAQLEDVAARDLSQDVELRLGDLPDTPGHATTGGKLRAAVRLVGIRASVPGSAAGCGATRGGPAGGE